MSAKQCFLVWAIVCFSVTASATTLQYRFEGDITTASGGLSSNATVLGGFEIDLEAAFSSGTSNTAIYATGNMALLITDPSSDSAQPDSIYAISAGVNPAVQIADGVPVNGTTVDRFERFGAATIVGTGPLPGAEVTGISLQLIFDPAAFNGTSLVSLPLLLLNESASVLRIDLSNVPDALFSIRSVTQVPLPAAIWLFFSAVAGLVAVRRKRKYAAG